MVENGLLECFVEQLRNNQDTDTIKVTLEGVSNLLSFNEKVTENQNPQNNLFLDEFKKLNGVQELKKLLDHNNEETYELALKCSKFFTI